MSDATDAVDHDLSQRAQALLEPGDIELVGVVVPMDLPEDDEPQLHQNTIEVGDVIAEHAGFDPADTYVYSGNDDPEFGVNQHQGLTVSGDEFVWECQQLYRDGRYVVVFYYEASADQEGILAALRDAGYDAVGVEP
ncbi:hypothetical protein BRC92_09320 [Halobacteriales archaeon QS_4_69_31]|jgi:hypothetical protein|nr:MAG: hypothetical protein BRC92_09320 [Halobacteriales archaeon QS_4_69_31]